MIGKYLGLLLLAVLSLMTYLYFYLGFTKSVNIQVEQRGPFVLVYRNHIGAYHMIGPTIEAVEQWAKDQNLRCALTFGEYLDDPAALDQDRLRSRGGCLFQSLPPTLTLPTDMMREERPQRRYVVGRFEGSPSIGPFKAYPEIQKYIETHRLKNEGAVMETYFIQGDKVVTEFLFPVME